MRPGARANPLSRPYRRLVIGPRRAHSAAAAQAAEPIKIGVYASLTDGRVGPLQFAYDSVSTNGDVIERTALSEPGKIRDALATTANLG